MIRKLIMLVSLLLLPLFSFLSSADYPRPWQMHLQEPASPVMEKFFWFHEHLLIMCFGVSGLICLLLIYVCIRYSKRFNPVPSKCSHNTLIEIVWTVVPVIILLVIAFPSFHSLYFAEKIENTDFAIKIVGRQWYWEYHYPDHGDINFESRLIADKDLKPGDKRLLEVDNPLVLPVNKKIRLLITGGDVIHSWGVPSLGVKKDAVPGRTNEVWVSINKEGVYYGHCYELCGVDHGFMPIKIIAMKEEDFNNWLQGAKTKFSSLDLDYKIAKLGE
jgi:cytochrome c oxidase subunit 2